MTAAMARDDGAIVAARSALLPNCLGCHVKHARRLPDFTLSIVTPPAPARPAPIASRKARPDGNFILTAGRRLLIAAFTVMRSVTSGNPERRSRRTEDAEITP